MCHSNMKINPTLYINWKMSVCSCIPLLPTKVARKYDNTGIKPLHTAFTFDLHRVPINKTKQRIKFNPPVEIVHYYRLSTLIAIPPREAIRRLGSSQVKGCPENPAYCLRSSRFTYPRGSSKNYCGSLPAPYRSSLSSIPL